MNENENNPTQGAVDAPTKEDAEQFLALAKSDPELRAQVLKGEFIGVTKNPAWAAWNAATEVAAGVEPKPEEPKPDPVLDAPTSPAAYKVQDLMGHPVQMDAENKTLVNETLLPAAHSLGLSQVDLNMIVPNVLKPMDDNACEATLRKVWGRDFDARLDDFRHAMAAATANIRKLVDDHPDTIGNNAHAIIAVVNAWRRKQGR